MLLVSECRSWEFNLPEVAQYWLHLLHTLPGADNCIYIMSPTRGSKVMISVETHFSELKT